MPKLRNKILIISGISIVAITLISMGTEFISHGQMSLDLFRRSYLLFFGIGNILFGITDDSTNETEKMSYKIGLVAYALALVILIVVNFLEYGQPLAP